MERRPTSILTTLAVSVLSLTLIAPRGLGQDPDRIAEIRRRAEQTSSLTRYHENLFGHWPHGRSSPMPSQPACFHRLDEIFTALRAIESTRLDRLAVEKFLRVS